MKTNNLDVIKMETIEKGFPELSDSIITINYKTMKDTYFEFDRLRKREYHIDIDNSLRHTKKTVLIGGLAHELGHIYLDHNRNWLTHEIDKFLYNSFEKYEIWDERRTDLLVVKKGLGHELLKFLNYVNQRRVGFNRKDGLTAGEVKKLLELKI